MKQEIKERIELINKGIVPAGYKKTPVGICPVEWEVNIYNNLGKFSKGCGIPGYSMIDSGLPCVGYGDIYTKYNIKFNLVKCFTDKITAKDSKKIPKDTLLFTGSGETAEEIGKCVCYCGDEDIYAGGDIILFNTEKVNTLFLSYQQNLWSFVKEKAKLGQGHSVVHIYPNDISKLHAIFPKTFIEQERIVKILDCATRQVELQEQLVDKLKVQKKALMQKLLTPQPDWQEVKLGDICEDIYQPQTVPQKEFKNNGYKVYGANGFIGFYDKYNHKEWQVVLSCRGDCGTINKTEPESWINGNAMVLKMEGNELIDKNYFYYQCLATSFKDVIDNSGIPQITRTPLLKKNFRFIKNMKVQKKIANFFINIDKLIELQQKLLWQYKLRQKAFMQLLLTGIVRVG